MAYTLKIHVCKYLAKLLTSMLAWSKQTLITKIHTFNSLLVFDHWTSNPCTGRRQNPVTLELAQHNGVSPSPSLHVDTPINCFNFNEFIDFLVNNIQKICLKKLSIGEIEYSSTMRSSPSTMTSRSHFCCSSIRQNPGCSCDIVQLSFQHFWRN